MNKKFVFAVVVVLIIIIAIILFGLRSCEPRVKEQPITEDGKTQTQVERNDFINANIDFTCEILKNPALKNDKTLTETRVKEVFKKHNLPVDSNEAMITLLKKYENDTEITEIVKTNAKPCAQGGDPIFVE